MNQRQKLALGLWLTVGSVCAQTVTGQTGTTDGIWRSDSLQEVVVTATGTQHLLKDAPVQTEVITSRMLRQYGGSSLQDILAGLAPSLSFNEGDMGSQMQLGGLGNNYILVLVDGKRLHGDVGGENDFKYYEKTGKLSDNEYNALVKELSGISVIDIGENPGNSRSTPSSRSPTAEKRPLRRNTALMIRCMTSFIPRYGRDIRHTSFARSLMNQINCLGFPPQKNLFRKS